MTGVMEDIEADSTGGKPVGNTQDQLRPRRVDGEKTGE